MKKNKVIGIVCTVALHVLVLLLLFLLKLTVPAEQEEGGVPVMLGNTELAAGDADPYTMTEVDVMPSEAPYFCTGSCSGARGRTAHDYAAG